MSKGEQHMKFQDRHKHFALECFAQFMTRKKAVNAFMETFKEELPKPQNLTQEPTEQYLRDRNKYVRTCMRAIYEQYRDELGENAKQQYDKDQEEFKKIFCKEYDNEFLQYHLKEEQEKQINQHTQQLKTQISNQIRRYNIEDA